MELKYDDYFREDALFMISRSDFKFITSGDNIFIKHIEIKDENNAIEEIKKSFENETKYRDTNSAIIYIKSKGNVTLERQFRIVEAIRELYESEYEELFVDLNVIYGLEVDDKLDVDLKITYIASKIDDKCM